MMCSVESEPLFIFHEARRFHFFERCAALIHPGQQNAEVLASKFKIEARHLGCGLRLFQIAIRVARICGYPAARPFSLRAQLTDIRLDLCRSGIGRTPGVQWDFKRDTNLSIMPLESSIKVFIIIEPAQ